MEHDPDQIAARVTELRERSGLSMDGLAKAMGYKGASSYQRWEDAPTYAKGFLNPKIVRLLETALVGKGSPPISREEVWELAGPEFTAAQPMGADVEAGGALKVLTVAGTYLAKRDFPIYPAAMGGDGHVLITFDPLEYVERPAMLQHVSDAYGVLVVGESMVPAFRPGDVAWVNPRLPPMREADVVLFHEPPTNEAECMIKQLNNWTGAEWTLEQFNPRREFTVSRAEWRTCHRVVGKQSRR